MMRRFLCAVLLLTLGLSSEVRAQQQMAENVPVTTLNANAGAAPQTGTAFAIAGQLNTFTWTVSFASAPASVTTLLETSNDNSVWATADTSTATAGESRTIFSAARFIRATESARSGGGAITVTINARRSPVSNTSLSSASALDVASITVNSSTVPTVRLGKNNVYMQGRNAADNGWINMFGISTSNNINVGAVLDSNGINVGGTATAGAVTGGGTNSVSGFQAIQTAAAGYFGWSGRAGILSSANGLVNVMRNDQAGNGFQINTGTAAPSVGTCGTGAITAGSTNSAGSFTTTGASACTLTFGAPAWTNTPFCVFAPKTTAEAYRVSAESTTAVTITFTTAGNAFSYVCFGRAF